MVSVQTSEAWALAPADSQNPARSSSGGKPLLWLLAHAAVSYSNVKAPEALAATIEGSGTAR